MPSEVQYGGRRAGAPAPTDGRPVPNGTPQPTNGHPIPPDERRPDAEAVPPNSGGRRRRPDGDVPPPPPVRPGGRRRRAEPEAFDLPTDINRPDGDLLDPGAPAGTTPPRRGAPVDAPTEVLAPATEVIPRIRPDLDRPTERIAAAPAATAFAPVPEPETDDDPVDRADDRYEDDHDEDDHYDDDHYDDEYDEDEDTAPAPRTSRVAKAITAAGEVMVTLGVVVLLFVVYEVWITDLISAGKQDDVTSALDEQWNAPGDDPQRQQRFEFAEGEGMAKLYIPALGEDYKFTVVEGTTDADLEIGPGHYKNSALPGQRGNFAVAGHRVGKGAPFNDLDLLQACDAIVVETQTSWFVYRMLPTDADARTWAESKAADPKCAGKDGGSKVEPLGGEYAKATGRQIVTPQQSEVVAPVPGKVDSTLAKDQRLKLITLTTCHPKFSNKERMILQGVMVREQPKTADHTVVPVELGETS
ncbi:class E sortase [Actinokineospora sp. PR83]|uniref:class E sortase n=1 Tax=Actinokineospora sp. PR83 TaxID=2884908 RepID=UPI0027E06B51|nr:class E sortase [Actinokineospora sp. PR83]MCG8914984.1 class E sortase [Actinokineospora sp. PR83]